MSPPPSPSSPRLHGVMSGFFAFVSLTKWECLWRFSQNQKQLYQVTYSIARYDVILQYTICDESVIIYFITQGLSGVRKRMKERRLNLILTLCVRF